MALSTHIQGLSINELLQVISNGRLSGVLTVVSQFRTGRIVFTWGRVTHASTDTQGRLGEVLLREGVISPQDLASALHVQQGQRKQRPIGTVLQSMGLAEKNTIARTLKEQMKQAFFELIEWKDGVAHLQIDMAMALASVKLDVSLDTQGLLLEAARIHDEAQPETFAGPEDDTVIVASESQMASAVEEGMDFFSLLDDVLPDAPKKSDASASSDDVTSDGASEDSEAGASTDEEAEGVSAGSESTAVRKRGKVIVNPTPPVGSLSTAKRKDAGKSGANDAEDTENAETATTN